MLAAQATSEDEARRKRNEEINDGVKRSQAIEAQVPGLRARTMAMSNQLEPLVQDMKNAAAVKLYNQAYDLFQRADASWAKVRPHYMQDILEHGPGVVKDLEAACAAMTKALGMVSKKK